MQKSTTQANPVRPYCRFPATKVANTGKDPMGSYTHFVQNDPYKNLDWKRDHHKEHINETSVKIPAGKCPHGTAVHTYQLGLDKDAKLERKKLGISTKTFPRNPTDNLSFEPPVQDRPFQAVYDKIVTAPKYDKNVQSNHPWLPHPVTVHSISNNSGGKFNIINHAAHTHSAGGPLGLRDKQVCNRKKGVTEFGDLLRPTATNPNWDHLAAYERDPYNFRRKNGLFTNLYDSAARFGETEVFKA